MIQQFLRIIFFNTDTCSFPIFDFMPETKASVTNIITEKHLIFSDYLKREVTFDAYLPLSGLQSQPCSLLLINDGQDLPQMPFDEIFGQMLEHEIIDPVLCVGVYCGTDRRMEYGVVAQKDYKGRGAKAGNYEKFILRELIPFLQMKYPFASAGKKSFAGFSLGALSALDIVWRNPAIFEKAGCFSGSFWWRSKGYDDGYNDETDRIMHRQISKGKFHPGLKFFFECGAMDELQDRNNNGIIDSIDDTMDIIKELSKKGYTTNDIHYLEIPDGTHDVGTWARAIPLFLQWGWPGPASGK